MTKEQRFPKWAAAQEKLRLQIEKLEKNKEARKYVTNFTTGQDQIRRLAKIARA